MALIEERACCSSSAKAVFHAFITAAVAQPAAGLIPRYLPPHRGSLEMAITHRQIHFAICLLKGLAGDI